MKIMQNNPYRITGILSNVTAKELHKQKGEIQDISRVGREITSEIYTYVSKYSLAKIKSPFDAIFSKKYSNYKE